MQRVFATTAFVFLSSMLLVTASERIYWYLGGLGWGENLGIAVFYMLPTVAFLWAVGAQPAGRTPSVVLAGAIYAFVVEGVLTTVIYEDGALPVLAALFVGWHGLLAGVVCWYFARKWMLARRRGSLALGSVLLGVFWGVWSLVYRSPRALSDFDDPFEVMAPGEFALYALVVGLLYVAAQVLIGYVWPTSFAPSRRSAVVIVMVLAGYGALVVLSSVPWAPIKMAALLIPTVALLRRDRDEAQPTVIAALRGHVRLPDAGILLLAPAAAALSYWIGWGLDPGVGTVEAIYEMGSVLQVVAGAGAFVLAAVAVVRGRRREVV